MRFRIRLLWMTAIALVAAGAGSAALRLLAAEPELRRITIVHTNDLHAHVEHAAAVAAVARAERARGPTLFLDAGDCITGTPLSTLFQGRPVFEVMNLMGYDAGCLGNHEFDHGWELVPEYRELAAFPLLCANARDPAGRPLGDAPYQVFEVGGVRVGVLGLVTDGVPALTTAKASAGCSFEAPLETARRLVPEIRRQADLVVLLTHVGVETDAAIAGAVDGIDLVVGGHSHTELSSPLEVNGARIVQARSNGTRVGIVEIAWDPGSRRVSELRGRLVRTDGKDAPRDPDVEALVASFQSRTEAQVSEVVGRAARPLDRQRLRAAIERIYREALDADLGYQNAGGVRAAIAEGEIRIADVWTVLPFDNTLVRVRLRGDRLPAWAKRELGSRLDPEREYVIATNSFVGDQRARYFGSEQVSVEDTGLSMRDVVVNWVREHGGFDPLPAPKAPGGR